MAEIGAKVKREWSPSELVHHEPRIAPILTEEGKMGINHEVDHLISGRAVETIAEPIDCHLSGRHRVKHEILQVLQGLGIGESGFVHVYTIHDLGGSAKNVCHFAN